MSTKHVLRKGWLVAAACAGVVGIHTVSAQVQEQQAADGVSLNGTGGVPDMAPKEPVQPLSAKLGVALPAAMPTEELPVLDIATIMPQILAHTDGPSLEGYMRDMPPFDLGMGQWLDVPAASGGGWLWVLDIKLPGAYGVRPHFTDFNLPAGAEMIVYDPAIPNNLPSPYTGMGPRDHGAFWAWTCWSQTSRIEVYFPPSVGDERLGRHFTIDQVAHMFRDPVTGQIGYFNDRELGCHNDVTCFPNWLTNAGGVGRMMFPTSPGFVGYCSGAMLNNNSSDLTPFFLTARHCMQDISSRLDGLEVYWFYQTSTCNGVPPAIGSVPRSVGSSYVFTSNASDMSMVSIDGTVPRNLWWSGWNTGTFGNGTSVVGIHHPDASYKRLSYGSTSSNSTSCGATGMTEGYVVNWASGATEPGSSGSPLYTSNGQVIGVDSCGINAQGCASPAWYGRFGSSGGTFVNLLSTGMYDDSYENNDSCGSATNLNSFYNGTLYSMIVKYNHDDWFHVTVPAFGTASFHAQFTHADGDIDMQMHDGCGGVLASSTGTADGETINWTNPGATAKEVYLHVYLYNDVRNIYYLDFARNGAVAPSNNACSSAVSIPAGGPGSNVSGSTQGGSVDGSSTCGNTGVAPDVWFRLSTPCTRTVSLSTQFSGFDTVLSVHTACPGTTANQVACNDDVAPGTLWSYIDFTATAGVTYYVRLSGYNGAFGSYFFDSNTTNASNDLCSNTLDVPAGSYAFNNCPCDTDGPPDDVCLAFGSNQIYKDFWMGYTPSCNGTLNFNTLGSAFDTKIAVYANADNSSCPPGPNSAIACNDDVNAAYESQVVLHVNQGQRYILRVGSYADGVGRGGVVNIGFTQDTNCNGGPVCDSIDFNGDGLFPDTTDIDDFLSVFSGGPCSNDPNCGDIDFNNDGLFPDTTDIDSLLSVFSGGDCI